MEVVLASGLSGDIDLVTLQKMALVYNAVQSGWTVKKREDKYIFSKPHENKKEVLLEDFLKTFLREHADLGKVCSK